MVNRILILGSSGQIGSHLESFFLQRNLVVETFDIKNGTEFDLRNQNKSLLFEAIDKVDFVVFLAFDVGGSKYLGENEKTYSFIDNNLKIMQNTFSVLDELKKPFLFASSQMAGMSHSPYGNLKLLGEKMASALNSRSIRFWNVYGFEVDYNKYHVISDFLYSAMNTGKISMLTQGEESRDFLHVNDACRAIHYILQHFDDESMPSVIDVASFRYTKILEIAEIVASVTGASLVQPASIIEDLQKGFNFDPNPYILDFWKPEIDLEDGIKDIFRKMSNF